MSDLDNFLEMLPKARQDFHRENFCGVIRITVGVHKFSSWNNTIKGEHMGLPVSIMYIFDTDGNYINSVISQY